MGTNKPIKKHKWTHKAQTKAKYTKQLGPTGLYELVLVAVHLVNFQCTA